MLGLSIWKLAIIGGVAMVLFGRGKISETMTDVAKGIKAFKRGMKDEDEDVALEHRPTINAETETTRVG